MRNKKVLAAAALGLLGSTVAWAFPWDIDMVDAYFFRAYEWSMMPLPEGVVSRDHYAQNGDRTTAEGVAMANPLEPANAPTIAQGQHMFEVYCATCHGVEGKGGAEVVRNDPSLGVSRYPIPPPMLSGAGAISTMRSDGYIYLTIRNGGALMPAYGQAMDATETWAIVSYIRTLEGARYTPPKPAGGE
jgi:mono/diheme cytochrome c family protein